MLPSNYLVFRRFSSYLLDTFLPNFLITSVIAVAKAVFSSFLSWKLRNMDLDVYLKLFYLKFDVFDFAIQIIYLQKWQANHYAHNFEYNDSIPYFLLLTKYVLHNERNNLWSTHLLLLFLH